MTVRKKSTNERMMTADQGTKHINWKRYTEQARSMYFVLRYKNTIIPVSDFAKIVGFLNSYNCHA